MGLLDGSATDPKKVLVNLARIILTSREIKWCKLFLKV